MNKEKLLGSIELKKKQLINAAFKYGFTHKKTIKYSRELDKYLNSFSKLKIIL